MKKCILRTTLSAFVVSLLGFGMSLVVHYETMFTQLFDTILTTATDYWFVLLPAGVGIVLAILLLIKKISRREKCFLRLPVSLVLVSGMYLLTAPQIYAELITGLAPSSVLFTTGGAFIAFGFVVLLLLSLLDLVTKKCAKCAKESSAEENVIEVVEVETLPQETAEPKEKKQPVAKKDKQVVVKEPQTKKEAKPEVVKEKAKPVVKEEPKPVVKEEETPTTTAKEDYDRIYHVRKRVKDDKWVVKLALGKKAIRVLDTQTEAVEYANELAANNKGVVRVFASKGANKGKIIS